MGSFKKNRQRVSGLRKYNKIVSTLVKDYKKRGQSYDIKDVRRTASSIYPNFKETPFKSLKKRQILTATPKGLLKTQRGYVKEVAPYLDDSLTTPSPDNYYFGLGTFPFDFKTLASNEIYFKSTISDPDLPLLQGGVDQPVDLYPRYFAPFVNFIDRSRKEGKIDYVDLHVICTEPEKDPKTNKWISTIIVTNPDGDELDPDLQGIIDEFDPTATYEELPKPPPAEKKEKKAKPEDEITLQIEKERAKTAQAIAEEEKAKTIRLALEMLQKGQISHNTFDEIIGKLS